ncbi:MAG: glycosyltransferase family 2 protein [Clostridia bacterium]|nr:glycosyltransferase family 2 protein [Clostridia bacterium]
MLLSLIVPFYQVEAYIGECLEPLRTLPDDTCEILLVDDCGQDRSRSIAEAFCAGQKNARILSRIQNGGLSAARNTGFSEAAGEYVFFLDSDDIPNPENILKLTKTAMEKQLDIIMGTFEYLDDVSHKCTDGPARPESEEMAGPRLFADESVVERYEPMVWQCIFRRDFLKRCGLVMTEGILFEDELFTTPALLQADKVMSSALKLIQYRQRRDSIMGSFQKSSRWCESYLTVCRSLSDFNAVHPTEASLLLDERIAKIALSLGKNIPAYHLEGTVRQEALGFIRSHRAEIAAFTGKGRSLSLKMQGLLLNVAPKLFVQMYAFMDRWRGGKS